MWRWPAVSSQPRISRNAIAISSVRRRGASEDCPSFPSASMTVARSGGPEAMAGAGWGAGGAVARHPAAAHGRLHFMDNLRVALTILIVFQHASFAYASANWWYYTDPQQQPLLASFFVVNRSFRMSLFFLIAGYFMPYVLDRKGPWLYLRDRSLR